MNKLAIVLLLAAACGKGGDKSDSPRDKLLDTWKGAGLAPSSFTSAQTNVGTDCALGMVSGLEILLCVYHSPTEAQSAEAAGYTWIGTNTGSAQAKGLVLVAIADRKKADPSGKTINQLMKLATPSK